MKGKGGKEERSNKINKYKRHTCCSSELGPRNLHRVHHYIRGNNRNGGIHIFPSRRLLLCHHLGDVLMGATTRERVDINGDDARAGFSINLAVFPRFEHGPEEGEGGFAPILRNDG